MKRDSSGSGYYWAVATGRMEGNEEKGSNGQEEEEGKANVMGSGKQEQVW